MAKPTVTGKHFERILSFAEDMQAAYGLAAYRKLEDHVNGSAPAYNHTFRLTIGYEYPYGTRTIYTELQYDASSDKWYYQLQIKGDTGDTNWRYLTVSSPGAAGEDLDLHRVGAAIAAELQQRTW